MSFGGTRANQAWPGDVPPKVRASVERADAIGFELCVRPEIGRLLAVLAGGLPDGAIIGESGTGTGTGLAWMASAAPLTTRIVSYEIDEALARAAADLFADDLRVTVVHGDARELFGHGPFDLLVHDGGSTGGKNPGGMVVDPTEVLKPFGTMTVDDFSPIDSWPPMFQGELDAGRHRWLTHPDLHSTEIPVAADLSVVVARRLQ